MQNEKISVTLISGFLGSGKTTLLRNLLDEQDQAGNKAVIINDFGSIGIDGQLVKTPGIEVVEMSSGCICCTLQNDVEHTLAQLIQEYPVEEIYIEASGIADPSAIEQGIYAFQDRYGLGLEKTVTVLDIDYWDSREVFGDVFFSQLEHADVIVLNKIDQFSEAETARCLKELNEAYRESIVLPTCYCQLEDSNITSLLASNERRKQELGQANTTRLPISKSNKSNSTTGFVTFTFCEDIVLDEQKLRSFLQQIPEALFRIKGIINLPQQSRLLNYVGGKTELLEWSKQEPQSKLVFIGWGQIEQDRIISMLRECEHTAS
jgi:G3E family GTPase